MTEIRYIRRDAALPSQEHGEDETAANPLPENLSPLIRRVAGASAEEIELVILELQRVRDILHSQSERLTRDIARYANYNRSLVATMKVIGQSLKPMASTDGNARPDP